MLSEVADRRLVADYPLPRARLQRAGQQFQKRRFAGAVRAYEGDLVAPLENEVQRRVHGDVVVTELDFLQLEGHAAGLRWRWERQTHRLRVAPRSRDGVHALQHLD